LTTRIDGVMMMGLPRRSGVERKTDGDAMTTPHQPTAFARRGEARAGLAS
jgi:hypothetical protein